MDNTMDPAFKAMQQATCEHEPDLDSVKGVEFDGECLHFDFTCKKCGLTGGSGVGKDSFNWDKQDQETNEEEGA